MKPLLMLKHHKIHIHSLILDTVIESVHRCYATNSVLCPDVSCMNPQRFPEIREKGLPAMRELRKCLLEFDGLAIAARIQADLINFAQQWDRLNQSPLDDYNTRTTAPSDETGEGMEDTVVLLSRN
ncbi:hypothetical protein XENOCAPTIV_013582 [Xenoophorus captivus]|uniref:Uncharacterized protein n=1 Tax=Xenoophorus captivus TaxID=1517983 RepID=A0ABV0S0H4_9TELE